MLLLVLVPVVLVVILTLITITLFLAVLAYVCSHYLLHALRDPIAERYEDICAMWSAKARRRRLLSRVHHLKSQQFHTYYHGAKPTSSELYQGLSVVCDWWRQQAAGMPAPCMVYLRLTCKTLADTESLAARQLTIRAPIVTPNITNKITSPARRWKAVQAVSYMHRPEQLHALMCFAAAWPNLRQLQISKPQYMSWKLWQRTFDGSSSSSHPGDGLPGWLNLVSEGDDMLAQLHAALADSGATVTAPTAALAAVTGGSSSSSSGVSDGRDDISGGAHSCHSSSSGCSSSSRSRSSNYRIAAAANPEGAALHLVAGLVLSASHWPFLQTLSLSQLGLTPAAAQLLAHAAPWWPLLRNCNMSCNCLGASGILVMVEAAVNHWHQLQVLNFRGDYGLKGFTTAAAAAAPHTAADGESCPEVKQHQQHMQHMQRSLLSNGTSDSYLCSSSCGSSGNGGSTTLSSSSRRWVIVKGQSHSDPAGLQKLLADLLSCTECNLLQASGGDVSACRTAAAPTAAAVSHSCSSAGVFASWHQASPCSSTSSSSSSSSGCRPVAQVLCSSCAAPQQLPLLLLL